MSPLRRHASGILAVVIAALLSLAAGPSPPSAPPTPRSAADSLAVAAEALFTSGLYDSLFVFVGPYVRRAQASGDSVLLGRAIAQRGRALLILGRRTEAENDIDTGIRIAEAVRDTMGLMPALHFQGFVYATASRNEDALRCFERRLFLAQRTHSPIDEAWAWSGMGYVLHLLDRQPEAKHAYSRAIQLFHAAGRTRLEISPLIGLGRVEGALGNVDASLRCYQRAWVASREVGDRLNEMWATTNLGALENNRGDLTRGAVYHRRAYELARELNSPQAMVIPAMNLAGRAAELGDYDTAERIMAETRSSYDARGGGSFTAMLDFQLATLRIAQGQNQAASALLRPLVAHPERGEPQHRTGAVMALAHVLAVTDSLDEAVRLLSAHFASGDVYTFDVPRAELALSQLLYESGNAREALAYASRARRSSQQRGERRTVVLAMLSESVCQHAAGDAHAAATFYAALDSMDAFRGGITTPDWRETFGQEVARGVVDAALVLLEEPASQSRVAREEAFFNAVQRIKARTLLDRITQPRPGAVAPETPGRQRVATLRDVRAVLKPGEAILDFCVASQRSFLMVATPDSLRVIELPGPGSPLADRVRLLRRTIASDDANLRAQYDSRRLAVMLSALGDDVLGGAADVVERCDRLFISVDGFLAAVPFGLLAVGADGAPLMSDHDVVLIPSASVLVLNRTAGRDCSGVTPSVVGVASSSERLSGARDEVRDLVKHCRNARAESGETGANGLEAAVGGCDVLHIAGHALVVDRSPWQSGFHLADTTAVRSETRVSPRDEPQEIDPGFLSAEDSLRIARTFRPDPYLRAWQIAQLRIGAQLAVLSGCETAGGRVTTGEGTLGLTAAFMSAGVPVVVSSLWPIDDRATRTIMRAFYRRLADGDPVATALRHAQLEISRTSKYSHPYFWAGFTVVGDGSRVVKIEERRARPLLLIGGVVALLAATAFFIKRRRSSPSMG